MINTVLTKRVNNGIECWSRLTVIKLAIQAASCLDIILMSPTHPPTPPSLSILLSSQQPDFPRNRHPLRFEVKLRRTFALMIF